MHFSLEALQAGKGDALLLHWGDPDSPSLIVIDGGPGGVYEGSLRPRLEQLRQKRGSDDEPLPVEILMVSHIDDDHINGVLQLTRELRGSEPSQRLVDVITLWHNAFDDLLDNDADELTAALGAAIENGSVSASSFGTAAAGDDVGVVIASVNQGRQLRNDAAGLGWNVNAPFGRLIQTAPAGEDAPTVDMGGMTLTILGPSRERLEELQKKWDKELPKLLEREREAGAAGLAEAAAKALDESVHNLASLMVLAESVDGRTMLLTGDGRGDHLMEGLERAGRLPADGTFHVDLFKLPHHGSDRNVSTDLFRRVTADHYVLSGDGTHHNPEVATLEMISEARDASTGGRGDDFTLWLTNREDRLQPFFDAETAAGRTYNVRFRENGALGLTVDLSD
jgi:hypothetical protein